MPRAKIRRQKSGLRGLTLHRVGIANEFSAENLLESYSTDSSLHNFCLFSKKQQRAIQLDDNTMLTVSSSMIVFF